METQHADITLRINGEAHEIAVDTRSTLLDVLRERLDLTGAKKGCDHGQCGACTVLVGGRRANACLLLAVAVRDEVVTIEGLADGEDAAPDAGGLRRARRVPVRLLHAGPDLLGGRDARGAARGLAERGHATASRRCGDAEIRERMSGNLCRCGAYANIVPAIAEAAHEAVRLRARGRRGRRAWRSSTASPPRATWPAAPTSWT